MEVGTERDSGSPQRARMLLVVLAGLTAIGPAMSDMYLAAFPQMSNAFSVGDAELQLTLTASLIGLAAGQLLLGPLSDRYGRRRPLIAGMAVFAVASVLCAFASSIELFVAGRFVQGLAGGAGVVISRAIVRDLYSGAEFVKYFAKLMLVFGLAPVLAPLVGAGLLSLGGWMNIFFALAGFAVVLLVGVSGFIEETLPVRARSSGGIRGALRLMRTATRSRRFVLYSVGCSFAFAAMFAYIGSFSFVVQDVYGSGSFTFAALFGVNACGFVLSGQVSSRLVERIAPAALVISGSLLQVISGVVFITFLALAPTTAGTPGLIAVESCMFVLMCSLGIIMPSATAMALEDQGRAAGTAAALMGFLQLSMGAIAAPLVGLGGGDSAAPLGIAVMVCASVGLCTFTVAARVSERRLELSIAGNSQTLDLS